MPRTVATVVPHRLVESPDPRIALQEHAWEVLEDERLLQELSIRQWAWRCGMARNRLTRSRIGRRDMLLSTVARLAHALGKKVQFVLVDEVREP